jgi:hypothetical protein
MKNLRILITILILLLAICTLNISIEGYDNSDCDGCSGANEIYGNCSSEVEKDENGNCYKKCPYKCNDYSGNNCKYDLDCKDCGSNKFRVNCDGSINPQWGDNTILNGSNTCNYDTQNLDGKLRVITHNGNKNFWIIIINIFTIKDNPTCKPKITGKVIQIPKDKIPDFTKLLTPKTSTNNLYGNGHQLYLENLLKKSPDSLKDILNKNNKSDMYNVSNLN